MICKACGFKRAFEKFNLCPKNSFGIHAWIEEKEKPRKKRVIKYQIRAVSTPSDYGSTRSRTIARWDKKNGLLWRVEPSKGYSVDSLDNYWKVTEASQSGILSAIRQTGEYIANQSLDFHEGAELLDLLNQALAGTLDP